MIQVGPGADPINLTETERDLVFLEPKLANVAVR